MTENKEKQLLHCNFCGRSQDEVKTLITGNYGCICNECVLVCVKTLINPEPRQGDNQ